MDDERRIERSNIAREISLIKGQCVVEVRMGNMHMSWSISCRQLMIGLEMLEINKIIIGFGNVIKRIGHNDFWTKRNCAEGGCGK